MASIAYKTLTGSAYSIFSGDIKRDFIYIDDIVNVIKFFISQYNTIPSGIYNVGTGIARRFQDIKKILKKPYTEVTIPVNLLRQYQYYTCADLTKLRSIGYDAPFLSLEEGLADIQTKIKPEGD